MMKKTLLAICSVVTATFLAAGLAACGGDEGMTADKAAEKITTFTTSPTVIDATFKQTYNLYVDSTNASFKAFEKDIDDTVTIQADYTAGNVYYYGKNTAKDGSAVEQLVYKDGTTYYWMTTTSVKTALADEAAAKTKINELMTTLSKETTGYIDSGAFTYNANWVQTYILLGGTNISSTSRYFDYKYDNADGDGLKIDIDMQYVGYYGDAGVVDMGTDSTHTGATASITTDSNGYITSFSETMNNHMEMPVSTPPIPLDLTGTRSLTATYNGTLSKKTTITQTLEAPTVTFASTDNATVAAFDMVIEGQNPSSVTPMTSGGSISVGHWLALSVSPATGFEIDSVTVGGKATTAIATYYCYQITEADYNNELKVAVSVKSSSGEVVTTGTIVVDPATVDGCTIVTYGLLYDTMTYTQGTTIEQGQYVVVNVIPDTAHADYTIKVTVNDADTQDFTANWTGEGNLYCYLKKAVAGTTYTVKVTLTAPAAEPETPDAAAGTITAQTAEHVTSIKTYDYKLGDNSTLATESSTVTAGNYVAVEVECETGYVVDTVTVNGNATVQYGKYYCYKANAGEAYTVVVTAKQTPGTIAVTAVENATVKTYNYKLNDSTSVENESTTVDVGNFVAITVDCAEGYEVESVTVNGNATTLYGGKYYCYKATEAGATYTVVVTLRQVSAS